MNTNVKGGWFCIRYEIAQMLQQGSGSIVNTTPLLSVVGNADVLLHTTSKCAVLGLTKAVALQSAKSGICMNAVGLGTIQTEMFDKALDRQAEARVQLTAPRPIRRIEQPVEGADTMFGYAQTVLRL